MTNAKNCIERSVESLQKKLEEKEIDKISMYKMGVTDGYVIGRE
jgi:hypothetical protein